MKTIKLFKPYISPKIDDVLLKVIHSGYIAEGEEVKQFEIEFSKFFNKKNCVALNSGTSALELAYLLAGIKEGDEVIAPVLTFVGANIPLLRIKAKIIFADIDPHNFNIDVNDVKRKITDKTKAIIFIHFGGNNENLEEIINLGQKNNIKVIEDAAQAIGSKKWGIADFAAVSFQAIKMLTTGDGGMLICKNKQDQERAKCLRWFGMDREKRQSNDYADVSEPGYKYHMNNIAAVIGRKNLLDMDKIISHRFELIEAYKKFDFSAENTRIIPSLWSCTVVTPQRDELREFLAKNGIQTAIYHYRNDNYSIFGGEKQNLKNMNKLENNYFLVPIHQEVTIKDVKFICQKIQEFLGI